jgi:PAS domain S-box-containing protein
VSPRALYLVGARWLTPAMFPHLPLAVERAGGRHIRFRGGIPDQYTACQPFFYVFEGCVCELPRLVGALPATLVSSRVTPRSVVTVVELPPSKPVLVRTGRAVKSLFGRATALAVLEEQRAALAHCVDVLRARGDDFRRMLDGVPDPVAIHRDGTILWVNRALLQILGYDGPGDVVGQPLLFIVHESSRAMALERIRMPVTGHPELAQVRLLRRDGDVVTVELSPSRPIDFGGEPARLVVGRDVTERLRMQERLVTADRLSSLGLLAAGVAHEINNPLAYVLGSIEIVRREIERPGPVSDAAREALGRALEGVDRVRTIVRDLQTLSRADEHTVQDVDLRAALDATLTLAESEISRRARIVRDYRDVPAARVNAARLGQVILNLVVNAVEAMPDRSPETNELVLRTRSDARGRAVIEVADNGEGIAGEVVDRIFDPFFTTKPNGHGTGLGLAICHQIVAEAGGEIAVESTPGKGSTFRVILPRA